MVCDRGSGRTMLAGKPRSLTLWSSATIKAVKAAWSNTGRMMAPCMAPLIKRRARGHLYSLSVQSPWCTSRSVPPGFMSRGSSERDGGSALVMASILTRLEETGHVENSCIFWVGIRNITRLPSGRYPRLWCLFQHCVL